MNKAAAQYLRAVRRNLSCPASLKREFLSQLEDEVLLFCDEHDEADVQTIAARFGTAEEVAQEFLRELDGQVLVKQQSQAKKILLAALAIVILFGLMVMARQIYIQQLFLDSYFIEYITYEGESQVQEGQTVYGVETFGSEK